MTPDIFSSDGSRIPETDVLELYLAGRLDGAAREYVEQWLVSEPLARAAIEAFAARATGDDVLPTDAGRSLEAVHAHMHVPSDGIPASDEVRGVDLTPEVGLYPESLARERWRVSSVRGQRATHPTWRQTLPVALWSTLGGIVISAIAVLIVWSGHFSKSQSRMAMSTYTTGNGQRAAITLPDSSVVVLNVASRLQVPMNYGARNHVVYLDGEALFTVAHHDGNPFTVVAGSSTTRVLGTSFAVRHYATDTAAMIAVRAGKVAIGATVVTAQQQAFVGGDSMPHVQPISPGQFSFANGVLTLNGPKLSDAIVDLNRWYDADIRLADPHLGVQRITGKFASGSLLDLSAILELTFDVRVVRDGRVLTLYPR